MTNDDQLASFGKQLSAQAGLPRTAPPRDWFEAFLRLDAAVGAARTIVFLDEISWMGQHDKDFAGELKTAWDTKFKKHPKLILVLCGSVSTWIEANILNNTGFAGRASQNLVIGELPIDRCREFWGKSAGRIAPREILDVLSVTGGVPRYLEEIDPSLSANENIRRLCFRPKAILRDDFSKIFNSVFGENAIYKNKLPSALADAPLTLSEIADTLKVERGGIISSHLAQLETAGLIESSALTEFSSSPPRPGASCRRRAKRDARSIFSCKANAASMSSKSSGRAQSTPTLKMKWPTRSRPWPCRATFPFERRSSMTATCRRPSRRADILTRSSRHPTSSLASDP